MNKSDLKDGMMLKLRNDNMYSLLHGYLLELSLNDTYKIIASMDDYNDEFENCNSNLDDKSVMDVMKIYDKDMNVLWEREEVDWSKVPKDTKVLVSNGERDDIDFEESFVRRYFAKYENGIFYTYAQGTDIWTSESYCYTLVPWDYCKLVEEPEEEATKEEINENELRKILGIECSYIQGSGRCLDQTCTSCISRIILSKFNMIPKSN